MATVGDRARKRPKGKKNVDQHHMATVKNRENKEENSLGEGTRFVLASY